MSYWSDNPELWEEILKKEFLRDLEEENGHPVSDEIAEFIYEQDDFYLWLEQICGTDYALKVAAEAEADYWGGYIDYIHDSMEDR